MRRRMTRRDATRHDATRRGATRRDATRRGVASQADAGRRRQEPARPQPVGLLGNLPGEAKAQAAGVINYMQQMLSSLFEEVFRNLSLLDLFRYAKSTLGFDIM